LLGNGVIIELGHLSVLAPTENWELGAENWGQRTGNWELGPLFASQCR